MPAELVSVRAGRNRYDSLTRTRPHRGEALLKNRLIGTWGLVSLETRHSDGTTTLNPAGRFMFDADGNFAGQIMNPDRDGDTPEGYLANWGEYEVDEERQTFTVHFIGAIQAATMGQRTVRHVNFTDDGGGVAVFNTDPQVVDGIGEQTFITWQKISPSPAGW
jgi:Lipocalin-like domain